MKKRKVGRILAEGELTGHSHRVDVDVIEREDGLREFIGGSKIVHEEHKEVDLTKIPSLSGENLSGRIQEFDHLEQQLRNVQD